MTNRLHQRATTLTERQWIAARLAPDSRTSLETDVRQHCERCGVSDWIVDIPLVRAGVRLLSADEFAVRARRKIHPHQRNGTDVRIMEPSAKSTADKTHETR